MKLYQCGIRLFEIIPKVNYIQKAKVRMDELLVTKYESIKINNTEQKNVHLIKKYNFTKSKDGQY